MCFKIEIYRANQGAKLKPTKQDFDEIVNLLKYSAFKSRKIPQEGSYKEPQFLNSDFNCDCHLTATKFVEINNQWEKVSGYLIEKAKIDENNNVIRLTAHSVVRDNNSNLFELMECVYPLEKYYFIIHNSGSQGYDLKATTQSNQ